MSISHGPVSTAGSGSAEVHGWFHKSPFIDPNFSHWELLALVLNALNFLSEPIDNAFSRSIEHAADVYGQEAIHGIVADPQSTTQQGFQRLGEASLDDPTPHPFVDFWTSSHPSTADRAAFAAAYNPWATGQHPKYF